LLQRSCNKRPWRFFIIIHHSSYPLADFFCMFLLSFFYIMYIHALVTSSLQMRKISRQSRSKYKVTLRTRKRVKQMVFFYFFSFLRNAISVRMMQHKRMYVYLRMYIWVESTMSSLISVLHISYNKSLPPPPLLFFTY